MFTKNYAKASNAAAAQKEAVLDKLRNEEGEIASWMIVMAFLVVAAVAARTQIGEALQGAIDEVEGSF